VKAPSRPIDLSARAATDGGERFTDDVVNPTVLVELNVDHLVMGVVHDESASVGHLSAALRVERGGVEQYRRSTVVLVVPDHLGVKAAEQ